MLSASPSSDFYTKFTISEFYVPIDSEHKLNKTGIENWLLVGFRLRSSQLGTTNGESLKGFFSFYKDFYHNTNTDTMLVMNKR